MQTINIEKEDEVKTLEFIKKYKKIHSDLEEILKEFEEISKKKDDMLLQLLELRGREQEFTKYFTEKYGEGSLDLESGTYKIK